ncbi:MAG: YceI family protein [Paracoccaceae bacterium]|nr:YceI family protein [Paracoccaceae bacterium]
MLRAIALLLLALATPLAAAPVDYRLDTDGSRVQYRVAFGTDEIFGVMPVEDAAVALDFAMASNSSVSVTMNAAGATANFPFAAQALKGPSVLDTGTHPDITFSTTAFRASGNDAEVDGLITIRGVTRPITLRGGLFRERGQEPGDRSELLVRLTGAVQRSDFGADGFSDMVGDRVEIEVLARILRDE